MTVTSVTPLVLFVLVATISPGGATTLATVSGVNFGFRRSLALIAGMSLALGVMAAAAAAGLAALLLKELALQTAMKAIGSIYLLRLAWQTSRNGRPNLEQGVARPIGFVGSIGMLWINPKAWAMTLSAAATFATLANSPSHLAILLGAVFVALSTVSLVLWSVAGFVLARLLQTDAQWRALNIVLGMLLAASVIPIWSE